MKQNNTSEINWKKGIYIDTSDCTKKFFDYLNAKLTHEYVKTTQTIDDQTIFLSVDARLKDVNLQKGKTNKRINKLILEAYKIYKRLIEEMNWDYEISFCEAMKLTDFAVKYRAEYSIEYSPRFTEEQDREYFNCKKNLTNEFKDQVFNKYWFTFDDRGVYTKLTELKESRSKIEEFIAQKVNHVFNILVAKKSNLFIDALKEEFSQKQYYGYLKLDLLISNELTVVNVKDVFNHVYKRFKFNSFQKSVLEFKVYIFLFKAHKSISWLLDNLEIDEKYNADKSIVYKEFILTTSHYLIGSLTATIDFCKKNKKIKDNTSFIEELESLDIEHIKKLGKVVCSYLKLPNKPEPTSGL